MAIVYRVETLEGIGMYRHGKFDSPHADTLSAALSHRGTPTPHYDWQDIEYATLSRELSSGLYRFGFPSREALVNWVTTNRRALVAMRKLGLRVSVYDAEIHRVSPYQCMFVHATSKRIARFNPLRVLTLQ